MRAEFINIGRIKVKWSNWYSWKKIEVDGRDRINSIPIPNRITGVYEVRKKGSRKWLLIGRTIDLRRMIRECIVTGRKDRTSHIGNKIRINLVDKNVEVEIRWCVTDKTCDRRRA